MNKRVVGFAAYEIYTNIFHAIISEQLNIVKSKNEKEIRQTILKLVEEFPSKLITIQQQIKMIIPHYTKFFESIIILK